MPEAKTQCKTWFDVNLNRIPLLVWCHTDIICQSKFQTPKMNIVKLSQMQRLNIKHDLRCKYEENMTVSIMSHWHHFSIKVSNSENECSKVEPQAKT